MVSIILVGAVTIGFVKGFPRGKGASINTWRNTLVAEHAQQTRQLLEIDSILTRSLPFNLCLLLLASFLHTAPSSTPYIANHETPTLCVIEIFAYIKWV